MWIRKKKLQQLEAEIREIKDKIGHTLKTYNNNFLILDAKIKTHAENSNVNANDSELESI
jgi:hypothetical protein